MKSLFNPSDNREIIQRINSLSSTSRAEWGKMNVSQMLAHTQVALKCALGDIKVKGGLIGKLFGRIAKRQLMQEQPFKQNLPTAPEFVIAEEREFEKEKNELVSLVERFARAGEIGITKDAHPFFGDLTPHEWDYLQWKHLDHHLRQFGK